MITVIAENILFSLAGSFLCAVIAAAYIASVIKRKRLKYPDLCVGFVTALLVTPIALGYGLVRPFILVLPFATIDSYVSEVLVKAIELHMLSATVTGFFAYWISSRFKRQGQNQITY